MGESKLMVEVELDKAFSQKIVVADSKGNTSMVVVEYFWIPTKCERCVQLGHKESRSFLLRQPNANVQPSIEIVKTEAANATSTAISSEARDSHVLSSVAATMDSAYV